MKILRSLYLTQRFFWGLGIIVALLLLGFGITTVFRVGQVGLGVFGVLVLVDAWLLFSRKNGFEGHRIAPDKLSNGDDNFIKIVLFNRYTIPTNVQIIDELPYQLQERKFRASIAIPPRGKETYEYFIRPIKRGAYQFGAVNAFVSSPIGLLQRRYRFSADKEVPVYPSFMQMRKYELLAFSNHLTEFGIKKIRRLGHNQEFEQIKEYVAGDDYRTINWKATARRGLLMVNNYQDERAQHVYAVIDKGRTMKMPFEEMTLLDYAINASLVITNIALKKDDKAGLITFQHKVQSFLPASRRSRQLHLLLEALYNQKTAYKESNYAALYTAVKRRLSQRSLLLLFSNFESISAMRRQLPYLRQMAKWHLVVVIFFKNTELHQLIAQPATSLRDVYQKTIAEQFAEEKKQIVDELKQYGIQALLTTPQQLSVDTINKYLELKARGMI
uniref:DUF58 domain-containing protein n=1 Tax=Roseihalotalea indica TaxID=2867963 RepID=A0AA49GT06_9BACT|nr:DUF58 domain-containing protein [Tunicatimonas sp. TK19036]